MVLQDGPWSEPWDVVPAFCWAPDFTHSHEKFFWRWCTSSREAFTSQSPTRACPWTIIRADGCLMWACENARTIRRKADEQIHSNGRPPRPPHIVCHKMFYNLPPAPRLLHFSAGPSIPLQHFTARTPTKWKTAGSGTARSALCPILQWIPTYLSPFLLCPAFSLAACPHLRCGRAAETKEKQYLWEHASHPHMVLAASPPFSEFVSQPYSPEELLRCWVFFGFWQAKNCEI